MSNHLVNKWEPILSHQDLPEIKDPYRKAVTAQLLENQESFLKEQAALGMGSGLLTEAPTMSVNATGYQGLTGGSVEGGIDGTLNADAGPRAGFDPVLISLIRRSMPNLIAYDLCGVQPMSGPTGMIFAMRAMYDGPDGPNEALFDEADPTFSSGADTFKSGSQEYNAPSLDADGKFIPTVADGSDYDGTNGPVTGYKRATAKGGGEPGTGWESPFDGPVGGEDHTYDTSNANPSGPEGANPAKVYHPYVPGETPRNNDGSNANPGLLDDAISPGGATFDPNLTGQAYPGGGVAGNPAAIILVADFVVISFRDCRLTIETRMDGSG